MADAINPAHYRGLFETRDIQCIAVTRHLDFDLGCWFKYIYRLGNKDDAKQDFDKARWYMEDWFRTHPPVDPVLSMFASSFIYRDTTLMPIRNPFAEKARIAFEFIKEPSYTDAESHARWKLLQLVTDEYIIPAWWREKMDKYEEKYLK